MLYDDVINGKDCVGLRRATEDRELRSIIEDTSQSPNWSSCTNS